MNSWILLGIGFIAQGLYSARTAHRRCDERVRELHPSFHKFVRHAWHRPQGIPSLIVCKDEYYVQLILFRLARSTPHDSQASSQNVARKQEAPSHEVSLQKS